MIKRTLTIVLVIQALLGCSDDANTALKTTSNYQQLADHYFNQSLALDPISATYVGRSEFNGKFGQPLSEAFLKQRHLLNSNLLKDLKAIDTTTLDQQQQIGHAMLSYSADQALVAEMFPSYMMPLNQFYNSIFTMVQLAQNGSAQPFNSEQDYVNWFSRVEGFIRWLADAEVRMQQGIANKVVLPRVLVERMIPQLEVHLVEDINDSLFYAPLNVLPKTLSDNQKQQLTKEYQQLLTDKLIPALSKFHHFIAGDYLAASRNSDGYWDLPNGRQWYQYLANMHTTTTMSVEEIHLLGLQEVARILKEMDQVRVQVGFNGDLKAFLAHLSSDEQFFFGSEQELIQAYLDKKKDIDAVVGDYFSVMPKAEYVIKPVEAYRQKSAAGASYMSPAVDGSRPGVFYINTYNLQAQPKWGVTTLSIHEAAPGHHFQIAIKQELENVAEFQKFSSYTAFSEGWALYTEHLGIEMGLFNDPYQYFGKLSDEMLRAMRLVVDTGLHAKGWSREQAIAYMLDNSAMAETDVTAEVERYMAIPGQALSYKVGQLKIIELRHRAETALAEKFDIKEFHAQVLLSGALPMQVLESKIDNWIELKK
ncbi:DUF885 family protein [Paraferrimonas sp. SM1919]|uniref:DUF885 domain-containing protein n=1 Tax=Paraferrimonas sp. SM1919 TaxID=2662263 RepID=UPI0013D62269|nr:DUF885 domain-containing protein [Paraferrimonas sp. SM1919]